MCIYVPQPSKGEVALFLVIVALLGWSAVELLLWLFSFIEITI